MKHIFIALWFLSLCAGLQLGRPIASAAPVSTVFTIDSTTSSLAVTIDPPLFGPQTDAQPVTGTIDATFDFGTSGAFPATAAVTVTGSHVAAAGDYEYTFGFPPAFGVAIDATGIVADTTTPSPPATMTRIGLPAAYEFDASQFDLTVNQGVITVTGTFEDMIDLSEEPVTGNSPLGTNGTVTFTPGASVGPYTLASAALVLPIDIARTVMIGDPPQDVDLHLVGVVRATASFYVALTALPGDFNDDGRVDDSDYALWTDGFGTAAGATRLQGDADGDGDADGEDFLTWQANRGLEPPMVGAAAVPEPSATALALVGAGVVAAHRRRRCAA